MALLAALRGIPPRPPPGLHHCQNPRRRRTPAQARGVSGCGVPETTVNDRQCEDCLWRGSPSRCLNKKRKVTAPTDATSNVKDALRRSNTIPATQTRCGRIDCEARWMIESPARPNRNAWSNCYDPGPADRSVRRPPDQSDTSKPFISGLIRLVQNDDDARLPERSPWSYTCSPTHLLSATIRNSGKATHTQDTRYATRKSRISHRMIG